ncbi:MAG: transketolase [Thermoguttaceae bacterium]|nr:transketolase [Thermoguttaceae bacterium]MDW8036619.1 transketolase [Thermoguttaceae bacterium]
MNRAVSLEQLAINTIRTLAMDAVEAARSGHPGTPMALAPVAYVLFRERLRYDPHRPDWPNRDRFILSCGHASMLLYAVLHLAGVKQLGPDGQPSEELAVPLEAIRQFRQLGSRCPGHPEYRHTSGVETTTGPLGQGVANSVGMAIAGKWLAGYFNRPGFPLFNFRVYALCSDGDMMEGIGAEAASLAGHLQLDNLCWIYDDNRITIEGPTSLAFSEDVGMRFASYGWNVLRVADVNELGSVRCALAGLDQENDRPTLIIVRSIIAWGAPTKQNHHEAHGAPLGEQEVRGAKAFYGWPEDQQFLIPSEVVEHFRQGHLADCHQQADQWYAMLAEYRKAYPDLAEQLDCLLAGRLPDGWDADWPSFPADPKGMATRVASGKVLNHVAQRIPWLLGGSADLGPSNRTELTCPEAHGDFSVTNPTGRNFHFGVREHAMAGICNGLALCGLRPYAGTFFVFTDYMRPSMRLAAMMELPVLYILTHDSIGVGEDGPTHQPVEHLAAVRAIPNMVVIRPCDANETAQAYRVALQRQAGPTALVLSRQNLPILDRSKLAPAEHLAKGAYILSEASAGKPEVLLIGTGSEVHLCLAAQQQLQAEGIAARVISMPSWELFEAQPAEYRKEVFPPGCLARVAVEAGVRQGWERYLGPQGRFVGMSRFGASAPEKALYKHFGITPEAIIACAKEALQALRQ